MGTLISFLIPSFFTQYHFLKFLLYLITLTWSGFLHFSFYCLAYFISVMITTITIVIVHMYDVNYDYGSQRVI